MNSRFLALIPSLLLLVAVSASADDLRPGTPVGPKNQCDALAGQIEQSLKGAALTDELQNEIVTQAQSLEVDAQIRKPHTPMTMDYRSNRLNVFLDEKGAIVWAICG